MHSVKERNVRHLQGCYPHLWCVSSKYQEFMLGCYVQTIRCMHSFLVPWLTVDTTAGLSHHACRGRLALPLKSWNYNWHQLLKGVTNLTYVPTLHPAPSPHPHVPDALKPLWLLGWPYSLRTSWRLQFTIHNTVPPLNVWSSGHCFYVHLDRAVSL